MTEPASVAAPIAGALASLTVALDEPGADLLESVTELDRACRSAVTSYVGFSLQANVGERTLGFSTPFVDGATQFVTSLRVVTASGPRSLDDGHGATSIVLILYGSAPGAFVDLCADLVWVLGADARDVTLDEDLVAPEFRRLDVALAEMAVVDQAIGVLIGRGNTPDSAHRQLAAQAERNGRSLHGEAGELLASIDDGPQ